MFIIVMKILIHICNQIFCPIPIRNTLLLERIHTTGESSYWRKIINLSKIDSYPKKNFRSIYGKNAYG